MVPTVLVVEDDDSVRAVMRVLYVSGYPVSDAGRDVLQKPFSLEALECAVRALVDG